MTAWTGSTRSNRRRASEGSLVTRAVNHCPADRSARVPGANFLVVTGQLMRTLIATLTALTASAVVAVGCSVQDASRAPTVNSADLQNDIAAQLASAGEQPQEVTCRADLVGEVGHTSRCDVVMSPTNSFQPIVTVTAVDGATIDYEMTPALSREQ